MRQRDPLSPEEHRELDALDRALAGEPVDRDLLELEQLVQDVRADAAQMSPGFAARLEHQAAEGFPASQEPPKQRRRPRRWALIPAGGALAAALVALVVVLGASESDDDAQTSGPIAAKQESAQSARGDSASAPLAAPSADSSAAQDRAVAPPVPRTRGPISPSTSPRKVQRSATLKLSVPGDEVEATADDVIGTVDRFGGIVASSSIGGDEQTGGAASFDLRIPTERLDDALAALSKLGNVAERRQELVDITGSFTTVIDRLSDARAERRGLRRALGRAPSKARVDGLKARLRSASRRVARLEGELAALRRRADLATVSVTVGGDADKADDGSGSGGSWSPGDAARDALRVLEVSAGVALIALAVAAPLALLGALVAFGRRAGRRH
ncbi:MAG: DUF4349 domain-containing protein, partial [Solirubrobacteraceae bacterium]